MIFLILIFVSYIIGSFPTAVWVGKIFHNIDIREHGSRNAGATNTFRVLGNKWGWIVLFVDIGKGYLAASLPFFLSSLYYGFKDEVLILQLIASLCAVVGHVFPVFANFRGGKGVATYVGILFSINFILGFTFGTVWIVTYLLSKFSSLASILASISIPIFVFLSETNNAIFYLIMFVLIFYTHRENIKRLINKQETKTKIY